MLPLYDEAESFMIVSLMVGHRRWKRRKKKRTHGGSRPGKAANLARCFQDRYNRFNQLYFSSRSVFSDEQFRRRFRMRKELFTQIADAVGAKDAYFTQRRDCTGKLGIHPRMKVTAALRILSYWCSSDSLDENLEISETVASECVQRFCQVVIDVYSEEFCRLPTKADLERLLKENAKRGFPE